MDRPLYISPYVLTFLYSMYLYRGGGGNLEDSGWSPDFLSVNPFLRDRS